MKTEIIIVLLLIGIIVFSGCSSQTINNQKPTGEIKEFKVKVTHAGYNFYSGGKITLKPTVNRGDVVRFLATTDVDEINHNHGITIEEFGINQAVITANEQTPKVIEFTANKTGTFRIYCGPCAEGSFGSDHPDLEAELTVK